MSIATALIAELTEQDLDTLAELLAPRLADRLDVNRHAEPWLGVQEAATHLGFSTSQIYQLCHKRQSNGFPVTKNGSRSFFRASELDAWRNTQGANQ